MLGEFALKGTMYRGQEPTLTGELTQEKLQQAISTLPKDVYTPRNEGRSPPPVIQIAEPERFIGVKDGGYAEIDGNIVIRSGETFQPTSLSILNAGRVRGLMQIRDSVREVFRTQLDDEPDAEILNARLALNRVYDGFVRRYGPLTIKENLPGICR